MRVVNFKDYHSLAALGEVQGWGNQKEFSFFRMSRIELIIANCFKLTFLDMADQTGDNV